MTQPAILSLLRAHFNTAAHVRWLAAGVVVGLCGWRWGASPVCAWSLKLVTGFGPMLMLPLLVGIALAGVARTMSSRTGTLAYGAFRKLQPWLLAKMLRAASAFVGVAAAATVCWGATGSTNAFATSLLGSLFAVTFAYSWAGMVIIAGDLVQSRAAD